MISMTNLSEVLHAVRTTNHVINHVIVLSQNLADDLHNKIVRGFLRAPHELEPMGQVPLLFMLV